jgi:hypothetical protein
MLHRLTFPSVEADSGIEETVIPLPGGPGGAFTATGIAPDLHRTSLLMTHSVNQIGAKIGILS